jgi:hypothetical protein
MQEVGWAIMILTAVVRHPGFFLAWDAGSNRLFGVFLG